MKEKWKEIRKRIGNDIREYGWAAVVFAAYYTLIHLTNRVFCPLLQVTGLPCGGCGLTRAFLFILRGELKRAFYIQPMAYLVILFLLYCGFFRYIKGSRIRGFQPLFVVLIGVILVFYVVRMYFYFPDRAPYVYNPENILSGRIPSYSRWIRNGISILRSLRGY